MIDFPHKILVPQRPSYLVARSRLTERLGTISERKLLTLTAPAGYGKTSLLLDFVHSTTTLPICWYTLDRFDEDPWVFLSYLTATVEQRFTGATAATAALFASRGQSSWSTVVNALLRDIYAVGQDFVLVIDDWHLVDHIVEISELMANVLLRCPNCHLILASRIYPSLPDIMLLAARRQMVGLDEDVLRFTPPEVAAVLNTEYHAVCTLEQATALAEQSNGWITGILLSFQTTGGTGTTPSGKIAERQVYRFLAEQVFDQQPQAVRDFMLDSSLLDELATERCDAIFERNDSAQLLDQLLRQHVFITEINPGVLRYHPLFREFLLEQYRLVRPQRYRETTQRVARAYMAQEQWSQAFDLCVAAGELKMAQEVVGAGGEQVYTSGRLETLERWFAALPLDDLNAPLLCLKARVLLARGKQHEAQVLAELAERRMCPDEEPIVLLVQSQIARVTGRYDAALKSGQRALELAPDDPLKAQALNILGICHQRLGHFTQAIRALNDALDIERRRGDLFAIALIQHDLGICHEEAGSLHTAEEYYSQADAYWAIIGNIGRRTLSLNSKGVVQHLAGNYRQAHATLTQALHHAQEAAALNYQALTLTSLGDLYSDLQLWTQARQAYEDARRIGGTAFLKDYLELAHLRLLLRQRQYDLASRALEQLPETTVARNPHALLLLRGSIACGLNLREQALILAHRAVAALEQNSSLKELSLAYLLQAHVAALPPADPSVLVTALEQACQTAERLGYDAFLVIEALHMSGLVRRAQTAGWARATEWFQHHQDILLAARMIGQNDQRPVLIVRTLGVDRVTLNGEHVELGWLRAREVLYYLLAHPEGATPEMLREAIWPDLGAERSKGALKTAIYQLREALPRELIVLQGRQIYRLNTEVAHIDYDVARFLELIDTRADDLEALLEAVDLYNGSYLPLSDNPWSSSLRTYLEQRHLQALRSIAEHHLRQRVPTDALAFYRRILALDPLDESAHLGVMRCHTLLGNRAAAIEQYRTLRRTLDQELGLEPDSASEVEQLYYTILNG